LVPDALTRVDVNGVAPADNVVIVAITNSTPTTTWAPFVPEALAIVDVYAV